MTWACDQRLAFMKARIDEGHPVNRQEVAERFNCTKQTVASDWRRFEARFPGVAAYCARQKAYVRADLAGKQDWRARALNAEIQRDALLERADGLIEEHTSGSPNPADRIARFSILWTGEGAIQKMQAFSDAFRALSTAAHNTGEGGS